MKKYTIWSSEINLEDWRADILGYYGEEYAEQHDGEEMPDDEIFRIADELNADYLGDQRINLDIRTSCEILAVADLGLWNGRRMGYKELPGNVRDCLQYNRDTLGAEFYVDERGDLRMDDHHHDGTNYITFREWRPTTTDAQRERLLCAIYDGTATETQIRRYTRRLGDRIAAVYGWKLSGGLKTDKLAV